jgi:hypothetical protein
MSQEALVRLARRLGVSLAGVESHDRAQVRAALLDSGRVRRYEAAEEKERDQSGEMKWGGRDGDGRTGGGDNFQTVCFRTLPVSEIFRISGGMF